MGVPERHSTFKKRSCTDIICLIIFLLNTSGLFVVSIIGFTKGDIKSVFYAINSQGKFCGHDDQLIDKPFLFFLDITKCITSLNSILSYGLCPTPKVCVNKCPKETKLFDVNNPICLPDTLQSEINANSGKCAKFTLKSIPLMKRCIPDLNSMTAGNWGIKEVSLENMKGIEIFVKSFALFSELGETIKRNIIGFQWWTLLYIILTVIFCLIIITITSYLSFPIIIFFIIAGFGAYGAGLYLAINEYNTAKNNVDYKLPQIFQNDVAFSSKNAKSFYIGIIVVLCIGLFVHIVITCAIGCSLRFICECLQKTSRIILKCPSIVFLPILCNIFQVVLIAWTLAICLFLWNVDIKSFIILNLNGQFGVDCDAKSTSPLCMFYGYTNQIIYRYVIIYIAFGTIWWHFFIRGCMNICVSYCFSSFYWLKNGKNLNEIPFLLSIKSIWILLRYHIGSVALGSFLISLLSFIQMILEYLKQAHEKPILKFVLRCIQCVCACCQKILESLCENAYIEVAITGENFCSSAKSSLIIIAKMPAKFVGLIQTLRVIIFMITVLTSGLIGIVTYYHSKFISDLDAPLVIFVFHVILALLLTAMMLEVVHFGCKTLFFCIGEDLKVNDGSKDRPYKMGKKIMKILKITNKADKIINQENKHQSQEKEVLHSRA